MTANPEKFAELLTEGVHRVRIREAKSVQIVQDELGYALGREGGSAVEYWRKGHIPPKLRDVELLGSEIAKRGQLERAWLERFLECAEHPAPHILCDEIFGPDKPAEMSPSIGDNTESDLSVSVAVNAVSQNVLPQNVLPQNEPSRNELPHIDSFAPFIVGPPIVHPGKLFGREMEIKRIFDAWRRYPLQNVAIVGPKRSGKSSLLHYVKNIFDIDQSELRPSQSLPNPTGLLAQPQNLSWVHVDFQDVRMWTQARLLRHILETLALPVPEPCDLSQFLDVMIDHLRTPTIILMDEIGAALSAPELDMPFWWSLRSLGTNLTDGNLGFLIASHEPPVELAAERGKPSPFFNIFGHVLQIGPIEEGAARELIASSSLPIQEADVTWILETSQRWPILLQMLCHSYLANNGDEQAHQELDAPPNPLPDTPLQEPQWKVDGLSRIQPYAYLLDPLIR